MSSKWFDFKRWFTEGIKDPRYEGPGDGEVPLVRPEDPLRILVASTDPGLRDEALLAAKSDPRIDLHAMDPSDTRAAQVPERIDVAVLQGGESMPGGVVLSQETIREIIHLRFGAVPTVVISPSRHLSGDEILATATFAFASHYHGTLKGSEASEARTGGELRV